MKTKFYFHLRYTHHKIKPFISTFYHICLKWLSVYQTDFEEKDVFKCESHHNERRFHKSKECMLYFYEMMLQVEKKWPLTSYFEFYNLQNNINEIVTSIQKNKKIRKKAASIHASRYRLCRTQVLMCHK